MSTIANRLRSARLDNGLTIREVARRVNASEGQVSKWENNHVVPGADVLRRYVEADLLTAEQALNVKGAA